MLEQAIVACVPVETAEAIAPGKFPHNVEGSSYVKAKCYLCTRDVWLGTRGLALVEADKGKAVCMVCIVQYYGPQALPPIHSLGGG
jgi:hypothetical protein